MELHSGKFARGMAFEWVSGNCICKEGLLGFRRYFSGFVWFFGSCRFRREDLTDCWFSRSFPPLTNQVHRKFPPCSNSPDFRSTTTARQHHKAPRPDCHYHHSNRQKYLWQFFFVLMSCLALSLSFSFPHHIWHTNDIWNANWKLNWIIRERILSCSFARNSKCETHKSIKYN